MCKEEEIGKKYNMLTIIKSEGFQYHPNGSRSELLLCRCDCGNERIVTMSSLHKGNIKCCGCKTFFKDKIYNRKGCSKHPLIALWYRIRSKCYNPSHIDYNLYGARGIGMYDKWLCDSYAFIKYIESLPHYGEPGLTLDRIDNDGDYEPGNLRWADSYIQALNRRVRRTSSSGLTGISYNTQKRKYTARISVRGKEYYLGAYVDIKEALNVRNEYIINNNLKNQRIQTLKN